MRATHMRPAWKKTPREWSLLLEAGVLLVVARIFLKILPTARIVGWVRRPLRGGEKIPAQGEVEQLQWAVTAFSRNAPIRLVCFPQALAMYAMLRRRGLISEILYGAARLEDGKLAAHAWLRCEGRVWVGGDVAEDFSVLDIWKPSSEAQQNHRIGPN